jgi:hypothetical protein
LWAGNSAPAQPWRSTDVGLRRLYLDEATGAPGARFGAIQAMLGRLLASLAEMPASLVATTA